MRGPIPFFTLCLTVRARASETRSFKFLLAVILWLALPVIGHASTMNPTSEPYPTDPQFAFMAVGGAQALLMDVTIMEGIAPWHPVWGKWYVRIPLETVTSFFWWRLVQSETGAVQTVENDNNRATCAAVGALVTSSVLCVESWNFGLGGCHDPDYSSGLECGEDVAHARGVPDITLTPFQSGFRRGYLDVLEGK